MFEDYGCGVCSLGGGGGCVCEVMCTLAGSYICRRFGQAEYGDKCLDEEATSVSLSWGNE